MKEKQDVLHNICRRFNFNKSCFIKKSDKFDLGTSEYIQRINKAERIYGPYFALMQLMADFNSYDDETIDDLKYNQDVNFNRFCKKLNELVKKVDMTEEIHYFRNKVNKGPERLDMLLEEKDNWILLPPGKAAFHMHGADGIFNLKFISKNEGNFEVVYDRLKKAINNRTRFSSDLNAKERYEKYYFEMYGKPSDVDDSIKLLKNQILMIEKRMLYLS